MKKINLKIKKETGITLIALVITIILMLILAGVSIRIAINGGLFRYAKNATNETKNAKAGEERLAYGIIGGQRIEDLVTGGTSLVTGEIMPARGIYLRMSADFTTQKGKAFYSGITSTEENIIKGLLIEVMNAPSTIEIEDMFERAGEIPPDDIQTMDVYLYGDYVYIYNYTDYFGRTYEGWTAQTFDKSKTSYGELLNSINGEKLNNLNGTFYNCRQLTTAPRIPSGVTELYGTFANCESLITPPTIPSNVTSLDSAFTNCTNLSTVPQIPDGVINMNSTFEQCKKITTVPTIPESVNNLAATFWGCDKLTGTITINANPTVDYNYCFYDTIQPIHLTGASTMLQQLAETASNNNVSY